MHVNVCFYAIRDIIGEKLYIDIVFWRITDLEMKCKHVHWKQLVPPGLAVTAHCLHSHCPVKRRSSIFDSSSNCSNMTDRGETMYSIPLSSDSDSGTSVKYCLSIYPPPPLKKMFSLYQSIQQALLINLLRRFTLIKTHSINVHSLIFVKNNVQTAVKLWYWEIGYKDKVHTCILTIWVTFLFNI